MEENNNIVMLIDEDGAEMPFEVLDIIEDGGKRYAAGLAVDDAENNEDEATVLIMRIVPANDEEDILEPVEDTKELEHIFEIFKTRMEEDFEFEEDDAE